jgi:hypothetical protein
MTILHETLSKQHGFRCTEAVLRGTLGVIYTHDENKMPGSALIVGMNYPQGPTEERNRAFVNDLVLFRECLMKHCHFKSENIQILVGDVRQVLSKKTEISEINSKIILATITRMI